MSDYPSTTPDYQSTTPDYQSTTPDYQPIIHDYIKQHEQMLKEHNTKRIGYLYKGNGDWSYYISKIMRYVGRRVIMSSETKKRLNTIHPQAKIDTIYIEHYREGYPSEWSEKLL